MVYGFNCHPQGLSTHQEVLKSISGLEGFVFEYIYIYIYMYMHNLSLGQACSVLALGAQRS